MPSSLQYYNFNPTTLYYHKKPHPLNPKSHLIPTSCTLAADDYLASPNQCSSVVVQTVDAPIAVVWSLVRRFDKPQTYKRFIKSCHIIAGDGNTVGTLREVHVISGLPALSSTERLEILDDEKYVLSFSVIGGDHRLNNYRSVTTLHASPTGTGTVVVESYVVDVPAGNTKDETCVFVETIVRCNLQSLAKLSENMVKIEYIKR